MKITVVPPCEQTVCGGWGIMSITVRIVRNNPRRLRPVRERSVRERHETYSASGSLIHALKALVLLFGRASVRRCMLRHDNWRTSEMRDCGYTGHLALMRT